jgi:triacylglycerol lipase
MGEARAAGELARLTADPVFYGLGVPRGDGRLVLVLPGLFGNDVYLQPMHAWLGRIGYRPVSSGLTVNAGCPERLSRQVEDELLMRQGGSDGPVAIIGHSRGGILAYVLAIRLGAKVRDLILLGSPAGALLRGNWTGSAGGAPAARSVMTANDRARRLIDPSCEFPRCGCPFPADVRRPLARETRVLSICSPDDPIVFAASCQVDGATNLEVHGSHVGLVYNHGAYLQIARALAAP